MGPSPVPMSDVVNNDCIKAVLSYITANGLVNSIALEFLEPVKHNHHMESAAEIEVGKYETIVLPKSMVNAVELIAPSWPDRLSASLTTLMQNLLLVPIGLQ